MCSYYKGECTLDSLSVEDFCANVVVFNWCNYLLEELLFACEEDQEKGINFTYKYLLVAFAMWKLRPPMGRQLAQVEKGHLAKMFESWHVRSDQENLEFINEAFSKWYNQLIDASQ
jgi:hypothetical protein